MKMGRRLLPSHSSIYLLYQDGPGQSPGYTIFVRQCFLAVAALAHAWACLKYNIKVPMSCANEMPQRLQVPIGSNLGFPFCRALEAPFFCFLALRLVARVNLSCSQ